MITYSQQQDIISKIWHKYNGSPDFISRKEASRNSLFLPESKLSGHTLSNFKLIIIHTIFKRKPRNKIELLGMLNETSEQDLKDIWQFKSDLLSRDWLISKDFQKIEDENLDPYKAYKRKLISPFTVWQHYTQYPNTVTGRLMTKDIEHITKTMALFKS